MEFVFYQRCRGILEHDFESTKMLLICKTVKNIQMNDVSPVIGLPPVLSGGFHKRLQLLGVYPRISG